MARFAFVDNDPVTVADQLRDALGQDSVAVVTYDADFQPISAPATKAVLDDCSVVLMDLDLYGDEAPTFGLNPRNGIALEETIRGWLADAGHPIGGGARAYVLFSHELAKIAGTLGARGREHVLARLTGNEWVTSKNEADRLAIHRDLGFLDQIAEAVEAMPDTWPKEGNSLKIEVFKLLGVEQTDSWQEFAAEDAERSGLPLQSIGEGQEATLLRWLLHVALPFPSCLIDLSDISVYLRLDPAHFSGNVKLREKLEELVADYVYSGPLATFMGRRWWRAGLRSFRDDAAIEARAAGIELAELILNRLGIANTDVKPITVPHPMLVVDDRFLRTESYADISQCVRVLTDDWPDELERPWMKIETALSSQRLTSLVHPDDRYRLPDV